MQTLAEYVLTFVSSPVIRQLACFGKTAGVRRNLNFYWAFNEDKKQSCFNTLRSLHGLKIPDRSNFQGKMMHCGPFKWTFPMGVAGGGGGVTQLIWSYDPYKLKIISGFPSYLAPMHLSLKCLSLACCAAETNSGLVLSRILGKGSKWRGEKVMAESRWASVLTSALERSSSSRGTSVAKFHPLLARSSVC